MSADRGGVDTSKAVRDLARWTLQTDPAWKDPRVVRQTKLLILDSVGVAIAAREVSTPRHVRTMLAEEGGNPRCSIIGQQEKSPLLAAVLMNGVLVRSLDFNDVQWFMKEGHLSVAGHCSDNIPVALAAAECFGSPGPAVIETIAMGYELFGRLRDLMPFVSAWDGTSASGLVAAAMYGRLAGFDPEQQAHALAIGAMRCATPSVVRWGRVSAAKDLTNSLIAQSAVQGAVLAGLGVTGPLEVLDHPGGLHQVFDPALGLDRMLRPVEWPPYIMNSCIKPYSCIGTAQTAITAALGLHKQVRHRLGEIARIEVVMADLPMIRKQQGERARRYPRAREAACHSFTFLPAVAMTEGAMTDDQFRDRRWEHDDMTALIEKTELSVDPGFAVRAPGSMPTRVAVTFRDGGRVEEECLYHPGHSFPDRGLNADVVMRKFDDFAGPMLSAGAGQRIKDAAMGLETGTVDALMSALRTL
jgi:2-methylcitrate dehydratase